LAYSGGTSTRPPLITAAGIALILAGGLSILFALLYFGSGGAFFITGLINIAVGAISIWAGLQVLQLREQGRMTGLILAGIGAVFALINVTQGSAVSFINLALYAFLLYVLVTTRQHFHV
jgi:hypothetical protein